MNTPLSKKTGYRYSRFPEKSKNVSETSQYSTFPEKLEVASSIPHSCVS